MDCTSNPQGDRTDRNGGDSRTSTMKCQDCLREYCMSSVEQLQSSMDSNLAMAIYRWYAATLRYSSVWVRISVPKKTPVWRISVPTSGSAVTCTHPNDSKEGSAPIHCICNVGMYCKHRTWAVFWFDIWRQGAVNENLIGHTKQKKP